MFELLLEVGKVQITYLEAIAFVLALACVICNVLEIHWGWPLAIVSSALYCWLFAKSKLYGDAGIQIYFIVASFWGWWCWLRKPSSRQELQHRRATHEALANNVLAKPSGIEIIDTPVLQVSRLSQKAIAWVGLVWIALWGLLALLLEHFTDSDVAWADAFPTAGSLIGQVLLGRKILENWVVWQIVNLCMVALLAYKALWLTMVLYVVFLAMAVLGWRRWSLVSA